MKTLCNLLFLLLCPALVMAHGITEGKYNKQKRINKAYAVNADAGIDIENTFGPVFVTTWDEDKIELDILIKVSGNNEDWVNRRLETIDVDINALTTLVSATTKIGNVSGRSGNGNSMEISYTIKIPKKGGVKIANKYGDVLSSDLFGPVRLHVKYGNVKLAKLLYGNNVLDMEYCGSVNIEKMKSGTIKANYSKVNIGNFENLSVNTNYTDVTAIDGNNIRYDSNYGKLNFQKVNNLEGNGDYLTVNAGELSGNMSINASYTTIRVNNVTASAGNIQVSGGYNTVDMRYSDGYDFEFEVNGKYTNMNLDSDLQINTKQENNKDKIYKGFHKKQGGGKVSILGKYGNVTLKSNR